MALCVRIKSRRLIFPNRLLFYFVDSFRQYRIECEKKSKRRSNRNDAKKRVKIRRCYCDESIKFTLWFVNNVLLCNEFDTMILLRQRWNSVVISVSLPTPMCFDEWFARRCACTNKKWFSFRVSALCSVACFFSFGSSSGFIDTKTLHETSISLLYQKCLTFYRAKKVNYSSS